MHRLVGQTRALRFSQGIVSTVDSHSPDNIGGPNVLPGVGTSPNFLTAKVMKLMTHSADVPQMIRLHLGRFSVRMSQVVINAGITAPTALLRQAAAHATPAPARQANVARF